MGLLKNAWNKLTHTKALERSSGKLETIFFESVYRVTYLTGLSTSDHDVAYLLYSITVKLLIILLLCGEIWPCFSKTATLDELASRINTLMDHSDFYQKLATSMQSPNFDTTTVKRREIVKFWAKRSEKYLKLVLALGNCTLVAWYTFPLTDELEYNLIVELHIPFDYESPYRYALAYLLVLIAFTYIAHFVMVTDLIMQAHLMHLLCQFDVLADCFENLVNDCQINFQGINRNELVSNKQFAEKYIQRLGELVKQHQLIVNHTMDLRNTLSAPMLGQLAASGILICFIGYQAATTITESITKGLMSLLFLGYNVFELYIICRWCEEITIQSQHIGEAVYCSGWECGVALLPGVKSTIMLILARARKPLVFTAGGMYDLSLTSYTTLVKTSYSALTVLLRFRHDE